MIGGDEQKTEYLMETVWETEVFVLLKKNGEEEEEEEGNLVLVGENWIIGFMEAAWNCNISSNWSLNYLFYPWEFGEC